MRKRISEARVRAIAGIRIWNALMPCKQHRADNHPTEGGRTRYQERKPFSQIGVENEKTGADERNYRHDRDRDTAQRNGGAGQIAVVVLLTQRRIEQSGKD